MTHHRHQAQTAVLQKTHKAVTGTCWKKVENTEIAPLPPPPPPDDNDNILYAAFTIIRAHLAKLSVGLSPYTAILNFGCTTTHAPCPRERPASLVNSVESFLQTWLHELRKHRPLRSSGIARMAPARHTIHRRIPYICMRAAIESLTESSLRVRFDAPTLFSHLCRPLSQGNRQESCLRGLSLQVRATIFSECRMFSWSAT